MKLLVFAMSFSGGAAFVILHIENNTIRRTIAHDRRLSECKNGCRFDIFLYMPSLFPMTELMSCPLPFRSLQFFSLTIIIPPLAVCPPTETKPATEFPSISGIRLMTCVMRLIDLLVCSNVPCQQECSHWSRRYPYLHQDETCLRGVHHHDEHNDSHAQQWPCNPTVLEEMFQSVLIA